MSTAVEYHSIVLDENGRPIIAGTRYKILLLVQDHVEFGWNPEQLVRQHPGLTLGQAYAALAYYYEHQDAMNAELQLRLEEYEKQLKESQNSPLRDRLREKGLLP